MTDRFRERTDVRVVRAALMGNAIGGRHIAHRRRNHDRRHAEHRVGGKQGLHAHVGRQPRERSRDGPVQIHQARQVFAADHEHRPCVARGRRHRLLDDHTVHGDRRRTAGAKDEHDACEISGVEPEARRQLHAPIEAEEQPERSALADRGHDLDRGKGVHHRRRNGDRRADAREEREVADAHANAVM